MIKNIMASVTVIMMLPLSSVSMADEKYSPVNNQMVKDECGSCHMAFQPQMLPKKSWKKIMETLDEHFGEDVSLDEKSSQKIKRYMMKNAADAGWFSGRFMRGIDGDYAPIRITETPYWIREHNHEVPSYAWSDPKVKSKSNCLACHQAANKGNYDDD